MPADRAIVAKQNGSTCNVRATWNEVFVAVAQCALSNPAERAIHRALDDLVERKVPRAEKEPARLTEEGREIIKRQFLALGFVTLEHVERQEPSLLGPRTTVRGLETLWRLTARGLKHFARLTAIRAEASQP